MVTGPSLKEGIPLAVGAVAILVGSLVLVGWALDIEVLKRIIPSLNAMNPATAVVFALGGLSLLLLRDAQGNRGRYRMGQLCAFVVALTGLLKLVEVLFGWSIGVDQLLFGEKLALGNQLPNRMGPVTALNFLLIGSALLLLDVRTHRGLWAAQYFSLAAIFASSVPILGYAYGIEYFYGTGSYLAIALHTAFTSVLLSVGSFVRGPSGVYCASSLATTWVETWRAACCSPSSSSLRYWGG
jgi:hypothetical protein